MGGCKCTFKDCGLTTTSSKKLYPMRETHFFHFPVKDPERCVDWAVYSDNMAFLSLPPNKILNKVICDFHFKENNFMNSKRERLTKTNAIPTIYVTPSTKDEIDMFHHPTEWVKANKAKKLPQLFQKSSSINLESSTMTEELITEQPPPIKKLKTEPVAITSMRILNGTSSSGGEISVQRIIKKLPTIPVTPKTTKVMKVSGENYRIQIQKPLPISCAKLIQKDNINSSFDQELKIEDDASRKDFNFTESPGTSASKILHESLSEDLKPMLIDSLKEITEIKELLNKKQAEVAPQTPQKSSEENSNISKSQFNKVQLFNGIKRYLSPSLIALLRMELFATPGREYKKDEKIICQELLLLGDKTYNFFTDEWRLRLPAKNDVQEWIDEQLTEEDDDAS